MDLVIVTVSTLVALLAVGYVVMVTQMDEIKRNWIRYRCNPIYMPFASFVGVDTAGNFTRCTMKSFQDYAGFILDPLQHMFKLFIDMFKSIADSLENMRVMFNGIRNGFLAIVTMIFGKLANTTASMQYLMIRIRTVFMRVAATMGIMMNMMTTGIKSGESVMNGPVGQTINFLCFAPETPVELESGVMKPIMHVELGDMLKGGHVVTGTYILAGQNTVLYDYRGTLVTGNHRLANGTRVEDCPDAILTMESRGVLCCLDTSSGYIPVGDVLYRDFEFDSIENPYLSVPLGSMLSKYSTIVGIRRTIDWEVLVR